MDLCVPGIEAFAGLFEPRVIQCPEAGKGDAELIALTRVAHVQLTIHRGVCIG